MKKKKSFLKRNSGFIVGCVLAGGASFVTADVLMSDMISGIQPGNEAEEPQSGELKTDVIEPEAPARTTFETDPFTVTASGSVVNGVESEPPQSETTAAPEQSEASDETNIEGSSGYTGEGYDGGESGSGEWYDDGSGSYDESAGGDGSGGGDYSYDDGSGGGDYSYDDGSGDWDSSGGGSDDGSGDWDSSGGGSDDGSGDWDSSGGSSDDSSGDWSDPGSSPGGDSSGGDDTAWTPSEVIVQGISSRYIDVSELYNYDLDELRLIRNEIFALHGRIFKSEDLASFFSQRPWYVPTYEPEEFDKNMFNYLNDYEQANLQVILDYEAQLGGN